MSPGCLLALKLPITEVWITVFVIRQSVSLLITQGLTQASKQASTHARTQARRHARKQAFTPSHTSVKKNSAKTEQNEFRYCPLPERFDKYDLSLAPRYLSMARLVFDPNRFGLQCRRPNI